MGSMIRSTRRTGFTLVELLVVVTIIVAMLAMLLPSMGEAIYRTTLTRCSSNLKQIALGATNYASDHFGLYPLRPGVDKPTKIKHKNNDYRPSMQGYVAFNALQCPLSPAELDYEIITENVIEINYGLWWNCRYADGDGYTEQAMTSVATKFTFRGQSFGGLAGDWETTKLNLSESAHNDRQGSLAENTKIDGHAFSRWQGPVREPIDKNFALQDCSVHTYLDVHQVDNTDLVKTPVWTENSAARYPGFYTWVPRP